MSFPEDTWSITVMHRSSIWQLLWRMIRYRFGLYLLDTLLWMLITGLPAVPGLIIREFFNTLTTTNDQPTRFVRSPLLWIALLVAISMARIVAIFTGRITKTQHRFTINALLQHNLLAKLLRRPGAEPFAIKGKPVSPGEVISFFRDDAAQIEDNVVGTNELLGTGVFAIASLAILFSTNATLTLLIFPPLIGITLTVQSVEMQIKRYRTVSRQATQKVTGLIGEMFTAVQAIQVAGAETAILNHLRHLSDQRRRSIVRDQVFTTVLHSSLDNLVNLGIGLILLVAAQSGFNEGEQPLKVGDFALFVYSLTFVTDFLWFLGSFLAQSKQTEVAFERIGALLSGDSENINQPVAAMVEYHPLYLPDLRGRGAELPSIAQPQQETSLEELRVDHLSYRYPGSDRGITDISFTLQRGSLTVVTGEVGAGKTTLLRVLLGLLPRESGEIFWNGRRVESPDCFFGPPRSAYTPQVPQLFSSTLRENLALGLAYDEEKIRRAFALTELMPDLATMPDGLDTPIGAKGMRLSGGQLYRTAAARMLIRQPELLVFDDLSSALDLDTEQRLWSHLLNHAEPLTGHSTSYKPTYLIVSHRPFILKQADHIIVLKQGKSS